MSAMKMSEIKISAINTLVVLAGAVSVVGFPGSSWAQATMNVSTDHVGAQASWYLTDYPNSVNISTQVYARLTKQNDPFNQGPPVTFGSFNINSFVSHFNSIGDFDAAAICFSPFQDLHPSELNVANGFSSATLNITTTVNCFVFGDASQLPIPSTSQVTVSLMWTSTSVSVTRDHIHDVYPSTRDNVQFLSTTGFASATGGASVGGINLTQGPSSFAEVFGFSEHAVASAQP
jgi:hypothetical protein